jgi:NitT/TauT family transport system substrate-binding protein
MHPPRFGRALGAALVATAVTGCGSATATDTRTSKIANPDITVAVVANEGAAGLYIAQDEGLFKKAGLNVTTKTVTSGSAALPVLIHGSVQVAAGQYSTFIQAQAAGTGEFRVLAPGWNLGPRVESVVVPKGSAIKTVPQVKGKTIAVNQLGGIDQILTDAVLSVYGIKPGQVSYVAIPFQGMNAALAAHRVSAAYLTEPYLTEAEQQLGAQVIADANNGATQGMPVTGYTATKAWAAKYPATAAAFAKAVTEGNEQVQLNPGAFQKAMEDQLHLPALVADEMGTGTFPSGINDSQLQRVADLLAEFGALKKPFKVNGMLP